MKIEVEKQELYKNGKSFEMLYRVYTNNYSIPDITLKSKEQVQELITKLQEVLKL